MLVTLPVPLDSVRSLSSSRLAINLAVLRLDEVGKGLGLLVTVVVVVSVAVVLGTDVLHLVDTTAFGAALDWALTGHLEATQLVHVQKT